ncbi:MAG TPA: aliphatic sulfonate ABC transporter permease SsuC, partial [Herpetosiphonaceae bacterium]|nr:aliphatic sulfonate ABC transporter permease SsuC [Herpetosiphonaceae bacterium]
MAIVIQRPAGRVRPARERGSRWSGRLLPWVVPALTLLAWQLGVSAGLLSTRVLPAPTAVLHTTWRLLTEQGLLGDIATSARRALSGLLIGGSLGFGLGLFNGLVRLGERLL